MKDLWFMSLCANMNPCKQKKDMLNTCVNGGKNIQKPQNWLAKSGANAIRRHTEKALRNGRKNILKNVRLNTPFKMPFEMGGSKNQKHAANAIQVITLLMATIRIIMSHLLSFGFADHAMQNYIQN